METIMKGRGISVVIPNYNGVALLPQVLPPALVALKRTGLPFEIIVVDDASTDESVRTVRLHFPDVQLHINTVNSGFSVTANTGIRLATYPHVLLLNSDVKLEPEYFDVLMNFCDRKDVLGVMGRIIGWDDEAIQDGAKYPLFQGGKIKTSANYILEDEQQMKKGLYTMYLSGANAFFNKELFLKIGGFNEMFSPFYAEDTELSLRAWRLGYQCLYAHQAVCRHRASTTIKSSNRKKYIQIIYNRNKMFLHAIHLEGWTRMVWFLQLLIEIVLQTLLLRFSYLTSFRLLLRNYHLVRQNRSALRQLSGAEKLRSVSGVFQFIKDSLKDQVVIRF
ncbi:MAG: glycosyltransferase family 2 protein [Lacibacter sp.]